MEKDLPEIRASDKVGIITDRNDKYLPQTEALKQSGDSQSYTNQTRRMRRLNRRLSFLQEHIRKTELSMHAPELRPERPRISSLRLFGNDGTGHY
jgi:hypothetical protein